MIDYNYLKQKIKNLQINESYTIDERLAPSDIDEFLFDFGRPDNETIGQDWNGCDLDWTTTIIWESNKYEFYGSGYKGTITIEKLK